VEGNWTWKDNFRDVRAGILALIRTNKVYAST